MNCPNCGKGALVKVKHRSLQNPMQWFSYHYECKEQGGCGFKTETEDVGL